MKPIFSFGKKKKRSSAKSKKQSKLPKKLIYICKKLKVKTKSSNGKYKSVKSLKASCLKRIKILKKKMLKKVSKRKVSKRKVGKRKVVKRRVSSRKGGVAHSGKVYRFGQLSPFLKNDPLNGYSSNSNSYPGVLSVTSQMDPSNGIYGIKKQFFDESVPGVLPPEWYGNYQPDGSYIPTGYPFEGYSNFGKKRKVIKRKLRKY